MDDYIDRFEKMEYANFAYVLLAAYEYLAPAYVAEVRRWLLDAGQGWEKALGESQEPYRTTLENLPLLNEAREEGNQAIDTIYRALQAYTEFSKSEAELRSVFPEGTKGKTKDSDLSRLSCLTRASAVVNREGAPEGLAAYKSFVNKACQSYRAIFDTQIEARRSRREETGSLADAAAQWKARYMGACEATRGLLRCHGRLNELSSIFPHMAVVEREKKKEEPPPSEAPLEPDAAAVPDEGGETA